MAFLVDQAYLPAILTTHPMTDDEFSEFCAEHPDLFFEMTADGQLIVMPPTYPSTGAQNSRINAQLSIWAWRDGRGVAFDSSTGFVTPAGARRSPDAAWVLNERIPGTPAGRYWHFCPEFVIELRSQTDRLLTLREKMREWIESGAQLAWLIDPPNRSVEIYRPGREPELVADPDTVAGEGPVNGFVLEMPSVWDPFRT